MIKLRPANERGGGNHGWLKTKHSFSFADYYDPNFMGFASLLVINEDIIGPKSGFPAHAHSDMEIITYVLSGELEHKDNIGNGSIIRAGDVQKMSAGTGVVHSEFNPGSEEVHLLQIWILPNKQSVKPSYEQKHFKKSDKLNQLKLIASSSDDKVIHLEQDAQIYATVLASGVELKHKLESGRVAWVQVVSGDITINGRSLMSGDGASITDEVQLVIKAQSEAELLLFDLS